MGFLSFSQWRYYLFFYIGTVIRQHFDSFTKILDYPLVVLIITIGFISISLLFQSANSFYAYLLFYIAGVLGMLMVFAFFKHSDSWMKKTHLSQMLQYAGTRTLDIYLLHYFFLPTFLKPYAYHLSSVNNPLLQTFVVIVIAIIVLCACLITSYIIRINHFLGHYLFGVKYKEPRP